MIYIYIYIYIYIAVTYSYLCYYDNCMYVYVVMMLIQILSNLSVVTTTAVLLQNGIVFTFTPVYYVIRRQEYKSINSSHTFKYFIYCTTHTCIIMYGYIAFILFM